VDPLAEFRAWFAHATAAGVAVPETTALATADASGRPSARMVLLKGVDERGFVFFTNTGSRKARELAANPYAALVLYWQPLGRQVRVEGRVEPVADEEADAYWATRPLGSRRSAVASRQSKPIGSRAELEARAAAVTPDEAERRPPWWGGYRVVPDAIEFWEHRDDRLHDRIRYTREDAGWRAERLQP
jgi:pyridoxamine 5'-phosphate oxidase